jgi:hypothetical protein
MPSKVSQKSTPPANQTWVILISLGLLSLIGITAWLLLNSQSTNDWPLISIFIVALITILGFLFIKRLKKHSKPFQPDYYSLFIIGIIWLPAGVAADNTALSILGLAFIAIGLKNRKQWKRTSWKDLSPEAKRFKLIITGVLGLLVLAGLIVYLFFSR